MYEKSQKGILDIIQYLIDKKLLQKDKIIYLSRDVFYLFNSIHFIPNRWHCFPKNNAKINIVDKYLIDPFFKNINQKICLIKNSLSDNVTDCGIVKISLLYNLCYKYNLMFIDPNFMNEIQLINYINKCKMIVVSWGTAFFKNYIYISDECNKIIVFVIGKSFIDQYNTEAQHGVLLSKYKNATITYHIFDNDEQINKLLDNDGQINELFDFDN